MPRVCTVCGHDHRQEIDRALVSSVANRRIATQFGVTESALRRHQMAGHVVQEIARAQDAADVVHADDLLGRLHSLNRETADVLKAARAAADHELRLKAITRAEKQIELEGRLLGELRDAPVTNILIQPSFQRAQVAILHALEPHPAARLAVADALAALEASS